VSEEKKTYQTHDDSEGMSNSLKKLKSIRMPEDLSGASVLDIGCNEGLFCNWAAQRGAAQVVGIDLLAENLEFAEKNYGSDTVRFERRSWDDLPDGQYDLVLWLSAMHYELDPRQVFDQVLSRISDDGLLILECGVSPSSGKEMVAVNRYGDTLLYPTMDFLIEELLADFSARWVGGPTMAEGDPVPRYVFHCRKLMTTVLLVGGDSGDGKTTLFAKFLSGAATKTLSLDRLLFQMSTQKYAHGDLQAYIKEKYDSDNLKNLHYGMDDAGLTKEFVLFLSKFVARTDKLVVIEGFLTPKARQALIEILNPRARMWDIVPSVA
jgi:SAM-dependent methyltransferase